MNAHESAMQQMEALAKSARALGNEIEMPPRYISTLGMTIKEVEPGKKLVCEFPFDESYSNPLKFYLGGMTCALMDAVAGPLSYMAAGCPAASTEFSVTFVRPFTATDQTVIIEATVLTKTKSLIVMEIIATTKAGKLLAKARTTSMMLLPRG